MLALTFVGLWLIYLLFILSEWQGRRKRMRKSGSYRNLFIQMVACLENTQAKLVKLQGLVEHIEKDGDLDSYEDCLELMNRVLESMVQMKRFGTDVQAMRDSFFVVNGLAKRVDALVVRVFRGIEGSNEEIQKGSKNIKGCYFCSRPYVIDRFRVLGIKVENVGIKVSSCPWCFQELKTTGNVRVLYFSMSGEAVHWSKVEKYDPREDFWTLCDQPDLFGRKLRLVYRNSQEFDSSPS